MNISARLFSVKRCILFARFSPLPVPRCRFLGGRLRIRLDEECKLFAAFLETAELIEARRGGREEHVLPRPRREAGDVYCDLEGALPSLFQNILKGKKWLLISLPM